MLYKIHGNILDKKNKLSLMHKLSHVRRLALRLAPTPIELHRGTVYQNCILDSTIETVKAESDVCQWALWLAPVPPTWHIICDFPWKMIM